MLKSLSLCRSWHSRATARAGSIGFESAAIIFRMLSMHDINKNLYLCTKEPRSIDIDNQSLRFKQRKPNKKTIILLFSWLHASRRQINKYSELYTDQDFDVLVAKISAAELLNTKSHEKFGQNVINFLRNNDEHYDDIYLHMLSAGGSMWGMCQKMITKDLVKYGEIPKRIKGHVWDSIASSLVVSFAVSCALLPQNMILRPVLRACVSRYLFTNRKLSAEIAETIQTLLNDSPQSPALVFASKVDQIGTSKFASDVVETWRNRGINVTYKCFEDSLHIKHFQKYPEEYLKLLHDHWKLVKLLE